MPTLAHRACWLLAGALVGCAAHTTAAPSPEQLLADHLDQTFAGRNACNPADVLRPFVIEWDATDSSSFEAQAQDDLVVVAYEGCNLRVLDECRDEALRGEQGSYLPPDWTAGALESLEISSEDELFAKLPLGVATLGARVARGEAFRMEYYVAGTRTATRDAVYQGDLDGHYGCEGATHFVHAYNLGAFALGASSGRTVGAEASVYGFGAGGTTRRSQAEEKVAGDLAACRSSAASEVAGCRAPIRLSLRPIRPGENPEVRSLHAAESSASLNAAGRIRSDLNAAADAQRLLESAMRKLAARDGKGCLADFAAYARLDPAHDPAKPTSPNAMQRAQCVMLSGQCDNGKLQYRQALEQLPDFRNAATVNGLVDATVAQWCEGSLSPRDRAMKAASELVGTALVQPTPGDCATRLAVVEAAIGEPSDEVDRQRLEVALLQAPVCYARAGDCATAFEVYLRHGAPPPIPNQPALTAEVTASSFHDNVRGCAGYPGARL
ncbi:MAG: hypothetical protein ABMB14_20270 [Myxococcota bacterium]